MTEAEWLTSLNVFEIMMALNDDKYNRKWTLFGCACIRRVWHLLKDRRSRDYVEQVEKHVDGAITDQEISDFWDALDADYGHGNKNVHPCFMFYFALRSLVVESAPAKVADDVAEAVGGCIAESLRPTPDGWSVAMTEAWRIAERTERKKQLDLRRDIFVDPFHPLTLDPSCLAWNDAAIPKMAQAIYDDRAFDRLPILADALEDAGCDDPDILAHCRSGGEHVRGCWVVDLLLGKS